MNHKNRIDSDNSHENLYPRDTKKGDWINLLSLVSFGTIIIWFLGISTNGVFNFFSDVPAFQLYPFFICACAGIWYLAFHVALRLRNVPWIFMVASGICCAFFIVTTNAVDRKIAQLDAANQLMVEPGPILYPENPLESSFTIQNPSTSTSVFHIFYSDWWNDPDSQAKGTIIAYAYTNEIAELGPMQKADLKLRQVYPGYRGYLGDNTYFELDIWFMRDGQEKTNRFSFQIVNREGKFVWYRRGMAQGLDHFVKSFGSKKPKLQFAREAVPLPETQIQYFGPSKNTTNNYATISLIYSITNAGGFPAKEVKYSWFWEDVNDFPVVSLPPVNLVFLPDGISTLMPGALVTNWVDFPDGRPLYSDIINNKLLTMCIVSFQDFDGIIYWYKFKVEYSATNGGWEVRYLDVADTLKKYGFHDFP